VIGFYNKAVTKKWTDIINDHIHLFRDKHEHILRKLPEIKSWEDFDRHVTLPMHGWSDLEEYYRVNNARVWMDHITCPLLCLNAMDDPLISYKAIDFSMPKVNPNIIMVTTTVGGHLAWCEGVLWPRRDSWADRVGIEFFEVLLRDAPKK